MNFKGDTYIIDNILPYINDVSLKQRGIKIKIVEEYLLIYYENSKPEKINELTTSICESLCKLIGNEEVDYLSLELIYCINKISLFDKSNLFYEVTRYLYLEGDDIYTELCIQYSLLIIASICISNPELVMGLDLKIWTTKMKHLKTHNHLLVNSKGFMKVCSLLDRNVLEMYQEEIKCYCECYANSLPTEQIITPKVFIDGTGVSDRYNYYLFR